MGIINVTNWKLALQAKYEVAMTSVLPHLGKKNRQTIINLALSRLANFIPSRLNTYNSAMKPYDNITLFPFMRALCTSRATWLRGQSYFFGPVIPAGLRRHPSIPLRVGG